MIPGIVLASGLSSRMGSPKALLRTGPNGPTFVCRIAHTLLDGGMAEVVVVGRPGDQQLRQEVDAIGERVRYVANDRADTGQLSSIVAGLNAVDRPGVTAMLVTLVDIPLITSATVAALTRAFASSRAPVTRAVFEGRHGHPVIFSRAVFDELRRADPSVGAKSVVRAHARDIVDVDTGDPGVLQDVDRPEDYERLITSPPRPR